MATSGSLDLALSLRVTPSGAETEYPTSLYNASITAGPDGKLWVVGSTPYRSESGYYTWKAEVATSTTSGGITYYPLSGAVYGVGGQAAIVPAPNGENALWLTWSSESKIDKITTAGTPTEYSLPSGSKPRGVTVGHDGNLWVTDEAGKIDKATTSGVVRAYGVPEGSKPIGITSGPDGNLWFTEYGSSKIAMITPAGGATEPTEVLGPVPPNVECPVGKLQPGCRVLKLKYATETTAHGEAESEWGSCLGRLEQILYEAYNPTTKKVEEPGVPVAAYRYDKGCRLRGEFDPRHATVKTTVGYDEYGHLTAISPPGHEPWVLTYGTAASDSGTGRLLKISRLPATTELHPGEEAPKNTKLPAITGTAVSGVKLSVSTGEWSGAPTAYGYQWEDCKPGSACAPIIGATNPDYTLTAGDVGDQVEALVTAPNAGGARTVSAITQVVEPFTVKEYKAASAAIAPITGPDGNIWMMGLGAEEGLKFYNTVAKMTPTGGLTEYRPGKGFEWDGYVGETNLAPGPNKETALWSAGEGAIGKITTAGVSSEYAAPAGSEPLSIVAGPGSEAALWFTEAGTSQIGRITTAGAITAQYSVPSLSRPGVIVQGPEGEAALWFTERTAGIIAKITTAGAISEYAVPSKAELHHIAAGPKGEKALWFTENTNKIGRIATSGEITEFSLPSGASAENITAGPDGNMWFTEPETSKIGKITPAGAVTEYQLKAKSDPHGICAGFSGENAIWVSLLEESKLVKISLGTSELPHGETIGPGPGSTIEYDVPVEGSGAPHQMGTNETTQKPEPEMWGQTDDPVEATAIVPADEPQGWPATGYKRATEYDLDEQGRNVNVASPSTATYGSIATTEFNEENDITRTLSADNRATALAAGEHSAEVSKELDTENRYNEPECQVEQPGVAAEPGTRLCETLGPQHEIRLQHPNGHGESEVLARNHEEFFYDQGVPKEKPYSEETFDLVTETSDLALGANREDLEVRTTKTSYSGQSNRGWKLREPTSVTVEPKDTANPNGLNLTRTTLYNEQGQPTETQGASAETTVTYAAKFGEGGSEPGKFNAPSGVAIASEGNIWVDDTYNHRVEKFGPEGKYISAFGKAGTEAGDLEESKGIAIDSKGNIWVSDAVIGRLQEFSPEGKSLATCGKTGSEAGALKEPKGIAIDSSGNIWVADNNNNRIDEVLQGMQIRQGLRL